MPKSLKIKRNRRNIPTMASQKQTASTPNSSNGVKRTPVKSQQIEPMQLLDLHDQALLNILDYLDFDGLYNMYQVDQRFRQLIASHRIYKEKITLKLARNGEFDPIILDMLPYAKKLELDLDERFPEHVIEEIVSRCGDGQLKEATINVYHYNPAINSKYQQLAEKMKSLESLTLYVAGWTFYDKNILSMIINEGLKNFTFVSMDGHFLIQSIIVLKNLVKLEINACLNIPYDEFNEALKIIGQQLQEFSWSGSSFTQRSDNLKLYSRIAMYMSNLTCLHFIGDFSDHHTTANNNQQTIFDDLLTLSKLRSLSIVCYDCICNNLNVFLNRLCALRQIEILDFSWCDVFLSSGICSKTKEVVQPTLCQNLQLIPRLSLGCLLPFVDWNRLKDVLPHVRELCFLNAMDFNNASFQDYFTDILKNGHKLESLNMIACINLTKEFYEELVEICKIYRNGKGITIKCRLMGFTKKLLVDLKDSYQSEYVRFQQKQ